MYTLHRLTEPADVELVAMSSIRTGCMECIRTVQLRIVIERRPYTHHDRIMHGSHPIFLGFQSSTDVVVEDEYEPMRHDHAFLATEN
jgi:hypothetical protein